MWSAPGNDPAGPSERASRVLRVAWLISAAAFLTAMYLMPSHETIPFHLTWLGLCLLYGVTRWRPVEMIVVVSATALATGMIMFHHALNGSIDWTETAEVPISVALAVVIAAYLQRRHTAVAELARVAAEDRRRADLRQALVRQVSHELRTPITIARGYTEMIHTSVSGQQREDADIVLQELDRLADISQRLLTVIQVDSAFDQLSLHLAEELDRVVRRWADTTDRRWSVQCTPGTVIASRERWDAAVDCLLDNAVKFSGPGDMIRVEGEVTAKGWRVRVIDTGSGLTEEEAATLTAGAQLSRRASSGTGIGLVMVRTVLEAWGGTLTFAPGVPSGAVATITVPAAIPAPREPAV